VVITHPYEGGHPDHDSTALAVHAACGLLLRENLPAPRVMEMTSYHNRNGAMAYAEFLGPNNGEVRTLALSTEERAFKQRLFECYATQRETLRWFPIELERFRPAPCYDFTQPPHPGQLYYEQFHWGIRGKNWRALAREAL